MQFQRLVIAIMAAFGLFAANVAHAQTEFDADLARLNREMAELYKANKFGEAGSVAERALALAERAYGSEHPETGKALQKLAFLHQLLGRHGEAEALYKRAIFVFEKAQGPEHPNVAILLGNLASLHEAEARYKDAEPLYKRLLLIQEKALGPNHPSLAESLNKLAGLYHTVGRLADAEPFYKRSLAIYEKARGSNHPDVAALLTNLAELYREQSRYADAETLAQRALTIFQAALGPTHPNVGTSLNNLALIRQHQGRFAEAEQLYRRSLDIRERALGTEHLDVAVTLNNLALLYRTQGRYSDVEALYKRALNIRETRHGADHPIVAQSLNNLAEFYQQQDRHTEAEPLLKRSIVIFTKTLGSDHADLGTSLNNLAAVYHTLGRYSEAEPLYKRSLNIRERALGPEHPEVAVSANNIAELYRAQGRTAEAALLYMRSIAIFERALGREHPLLAMTLSNLASVHFLRQEWSTAAAYWQRSTKLMVERAKRGTTTTGFSSLRGSFERSITPFRGLVRATFRIGMEEPRRVPELTRDMFVTAQWAYASEAAASLAQMAVREAKADNALAKVVRERQDLVSEWQTRDKELVAAVSLPAEKRNGANEQEQRGHLSAIDARIAEIDKIFRKDFPDYAALAHPEALDIAEVQSHLLADEALVFFLDAPAWKPAPQETFIWVVTVGQARWFRSDAGTAALGEHVMALRCGLDRVSWEGEGATRCSALLGGIYSVEDAKSGKPLPFDLQRAHQLYQALFGQFENLIAHKRLIVVPSGPLTALPFQVLVSDRPANGSAYGNAAWLAKHHAITVLPSVSSLKALRQFAKTSKAIQPFIGFGNPLLSGPDGTDKRAWERQSCKTTSAPPQVANRGVRSAVPKFFRNGLANVEEVRAQYPLPETADELCSVAQSSGAQDGAVYLGERASEANIKALSAAGSLAQARIVHFATHGLLAGETEMLATHKAEPALLLTPPEKATEEDDGLLTASEIAQLKLDADWVVLSACNTAAGESDKPGVEALSGLARAFFYAGARALLVSHWAVNSEATVHLITKAFDELKVDPKIGRAEALRRSMLALVEKGGGYAHPANWAPFVVVGEGAHQS